MSSASQIRSIAPTSVDLDRGLFVGRGTAIAQRADVLTVATDGTGQFATVQDAIDAVPVGNVEPVTIRIARGTYPGIVRLPVDKPHVTLVGATSRAQDVVLVAARGAIEFGTGESSTVILEADDVTVRNLTIANAYDIAAHGRTQALALSARGDRQVLDGIRLLGHQDTMRIGITGDSAGRRVYVRRSYIEGDVDFIYGSGTAVLDDCEIHSLDRGSATDNGFAMAPSTQATSPYGFLVIRSRFTSNAPDGTVSLGRPWHPGEDVNAVGHAVVRESWLGPHVRASQPWSDMHGFSWRTGGRFAEFRNTGPGATITANRPQLTRDEAALYTVRAFLTGQDRWDPTRA